jgi:glycosyltransferase involved in cell wall biosynthesis
LVFQAGGAERPPVLTWIHHVVDETPDVAAALSKSDAIVASTDLWGRTLRASRPATPPVHVVQYGVDFTLFRRVPDTPASASSRESWFTVGFAGSKFSDDDGGRKGLDTLGAVLRRVAAAIPRLRVLFLGIGWDGEVATLRASGIRSETFGFRPEAELPEFYSQLDAYLVTSRVEGGPCTVLESMACLTPVVATRVGLVPEMISDGVTGFSADVDDVGTLANGLLALSNDVGLRRDIGVRARQRVERERGWARTLRALEVPYDAVTTRSPRNLRARIDIGTMIRAVSSADALIWTSALARRRRISPGEALRILHAQWKGLGARDHVRGLRALAGRSFWVTEGSPGQ